MTSCFPAEKILRKSQKPKIPLSAATDLRTTQKRGIEKVGGASRQIILENESYKERIRKSIERKRSEYLKGKSIRSFSLRFWREKLARIERR